MNFGEAIEAMKAGKRVSRSGWNGKGMWVALTEASEVDVLDPLRGAAKLYAETLTDTTITTIRIGAHIDMKAADGSLVIGWLASQTDMLADDWGVVG